MKKKLVVVGMLAAIAGVVAVFKSRKKYTKVRKNYWEEVQNEII